MSSDPLTAVYLAAGEGKRLAPLTDERPKAMIEVGGTTLAERALRSLREAGVERVLAITGHRKRALEDLGDLVDELRFNPRYDRANNVYSLWSASDVVIAGLLHRQLRRAVRAGDRREAGGGGWHCCSLRGRPRRR